MQFTCSIVITLLSALASAQSNPFKIPSSGLSATAGTALDLSWTPTTNGTISLVLRSGASSDLSAGTVIASNITNSGSYSWTPSDSITNGSDYAIEIIDDSDSSLTNYTPYFVIDTDTTVAYSTSEVTLGASATSGLSSSTASPTGSTSKSSSAASSSSATGSSTTGSSSASSSSTTGSAASTTSGSSSASGTSTAASQTTSGASFQSTGTTASATSAAGAPKSRAFAGLVGMAALGALAL